MIEMKPLGYIVSAAFVQIWAENAGGGKICPKDVRRCLCGQVLNQGNCRLPVVGNTER